MAPLISRLKKLHQKHMLEFGILLMSHIANHWWLLIDYSSLSFEILPHH